MILAPIFDYKTPFVLNALADGEHKSKRQGLGSDFYKKSHFLSEPNPARLDLASSLTDPFESLYVKSYRQRSQLNVLTLIDGSSSMSIANKPELISEFEGSIAASVATRSDSYAAYLLSSKIKTISENQTDNSLIDQHFSQMAHHDVASSFNNLERLLPERRSMIFLISDFHWSFETIKGIFDKLSGHYVVPIVLRCSAEYQAYKLWRFVQIQDAETAENKLIFVTPKQKQQIDNAFITRKITLNKIFQQFSCRPLWVIDVFNIHDLRAFFHGV